MIILLPCAVPLIVLKNPINKAVCVFPVRESLSSTGSGAAPFRKMAFAKSLNDLRKFE